MLWPLIVMGGYAAVSVVTFGAMVLDKWQARAGASRVSERTLHTLELLGGWPGSLAAMALVRHKNRKPAFYLVSFGTVLAHGLAWALWAWARL